MRAAPPQRSIAELPVRRALIGLDRALSRCPVSGRRVFRTRIGPPEGRQERVLELLTRRGLPVRLADHPVTVMLTTVSSGAVFDPPDSVV
jgi:hypothetical protein